MSLKSHAFFMCVVLFGTGITSPNWSHSTKSLSKPIVVALVDTGLDTSDPRFQKYLWQNPGETGLDSQGNNKATNGLDDDKNGYIDDLHGYDFTRNSPQLRDHHGHGTHIAGLVTGIAPHRILQSSREPLLQIMILKYYDTMSSPQEILKNSNRALQYAVGQGARVINYSGGGYFFNLEEKQLVQKMLEKEILLIAAAGNDGIDIERFGFYPASYRLPHILRVGGLDAFGNYSSKINFSKNLVQLALPAENIRSTLPGTNSWGELSGSSQATAIASHLAAVILSENPRLTPQDVISRMAQ